MFGAYLQGFIGTAMIVFGIFMSLAGFIEPFYFFVGFVMIFAGGFLKYLSSQTTRSVDAYGNAVGNFSRSSSQSVQNFSGVRSIENDDYQLFLVEKFNIRKNETLGKYSLNGKVFADLKTALEFASEMYKPLDLVAAPDFHLLVDEKKVVGRNGRKTTVFEFPQSSYYVALDGGYLKFNSVAEVEAFLKGA